MKIIDIVILCQQALKEDHKFYSDAVRECTDFCEKYRQYPERIESERIRLAIYSRKSRISGNRLRHINNILKRLSHENK